MDSRLRGKDEGVREEFEYNEQGRMDSRMRGKDAAVEGKSRVQGSRMN